MMHEDDGRKITDMVELSRVHGLNYITLRNLTRALLDKGELDSRTLSMPYEVTKKYCEFIEEHYQEICKRVDPTKIHRKITHIDEPKYMFGYDVPVYILKVE